ncbi:EXO84 [Candida pseudojiufengensis]|uniref:EXO84 n=1 Tax=Candida pseudojiufengensis TaxID=497109 RepID=UPI0022243C50|nr:EXO84 [Candida pseudojiufengensis]KAI5963022.1 EXO84 [Candida pseudojiufengensis]
MEKLRNRKSRAGWQNKSEAVNPYANANLNLDRVETNRTYTNYNNQHQQNQLNPNHIYSNNAHNNSNNNLLRVPTSDPSRHNRRYSIHQAAQQQHRKYSAGEHQKFDATGAPPLPRLESNKPTTIEQKIINELGQGSAAEVDDYYKSLVKQKQLIDRDIKQNINQNQKNILELTNDLKDTQDELDSMRATTKDLFELFDEVKDIAERRLSSEYDAPQQQYQQQQQQQSNQNRQQNNKDRSSVLVLEKMWAKELQSLFKHVDGASKFIQPIPGRHVLAESGRWHEVNPGTWKPKNAGHLFVLNDMLLIASKRLVDSTGGKSNRLHAIQCFPLTQVSLNQIKPPKDDTLYFINIKTKSLNYVYSTDRYDHLIKVTEAFNKGKNEMMHNQRLINDSGSNEHSNETKDEKRQLRESIRNSGSHEDEKRVSGSGAGGHKRSSSEFLLHDISAKVHSRNKSHDFGKNVSVNGKSQFFNEIKQLEDKLDEVDINISHNEISDAVNLLIHIEQKLNKIEKYIKHLDSDETLLLDVSKLKIFNRKEEIIKNLLFDLQNNIFKLKLDEIELILILFEKLDQLETGIQSYLESTSLYLSKTISKLIVGLQGSTKVDVINYLSNLMVINVSIVKRTILAYTTKIEKILKQSNISHIDSSGLIDWCTEEFQKLFKQVRKHLYGTLLIFNGSEYQIKDEMLYDEFKRMLNLQLEELKSIGLNVDYIFAPIINLK